MGRSLVRLPCYRSAAEAAGEGSRGASQAQQAERELNVSPGLAGPRRRVAARAAM